ncbi:sex hormone-binding globulin [Nerophis lumbriciformis]|uniref:sex hormone-binding globulin n=1 Tax=Nerophis lumbriciformis TaxID=546530 RepID=UPI002AE0612E|nr:sex hormone-binding globulin-like [Nerophis lumbriciformis]XP_061816068.1 sex hormone-binding globulin-like [Nerophis lumbriciformis]
MMAGGLQLLALSVTVLAWGALGQGDGRWKKQVSGDATIYLGQQREAWRPLMHVAVNLTKIKDIKSSFQLRTYDPEGAIFYGDTKSGRDWFVLSLKDGVPLMQISRSGVLVNVAGGPKLNDGQWHTLEVSNQGHFVILEVDGAMGLVAGLQSKHIEEVISGDLRLALGGLLITKESMLVQFEPQMDGCIRGGSWLNLSIPWETDTDKLWPCYQNIRHGSFFPGSGLAIVNTSVFQIEREHSVKIELWGDFTKMYGAILSIRTPGLVPMFTLVADNTTKEITLSFSGHKMSLKENFKRLQLTFGTDLLEVQHDGAESKGTTKLLSPLKHSGLLSILRESQMAIGGLLGKDDVGSFLRGCLEKIQIQGKDVDLDLTLKDMSISSHSCPV